MRKISISILDAKDNKSIIKKLYEVNNKIEKINVKNKFVNMIHFDIMDKKFVPNLGVDLELIKEAKKNYFLADVHLMVENPIEDSYIDDAIIYGADIISIHFEIRNFDKVITYLLEKKVKIGVAIKPSTDIKELLPYKDKIEQIIIMTVEPGMGGQKYIEAMNDKIKEARELFKDKIIEIDGGVNLDTIRFGLVNGVDTFVIGNSIINSKDYFEEIVKYNIIKQIEELPKKLDTTFDRNTLMIKKGGYGEGDILLGITVPDIRKCAMHWYKYVNYYTIEIFLHSKYHEYRRFGIFLISNLVKENEDNLQVLKLLNNILRYNIEYVNNWDLTDEAGPNILGKYLILIDEKDREILLDSYLNSDNLWEKRIGIVSLLIFAKNSYSTYCLDKLSNLLYEQYHLFQKAIGWVIREVYKKSPKEVVEYLYNYNHKQKLPSILLSYACEKMTKEEKEYIKNI